MRQAVFPQGHPLQRETEQLFDREGNKDLKSITKVMGLSREKKLAEIQSYIEQIMDDPNKQFNPEALRTELEFMKLFYKSIENCQPINPQTFNHHEPSYKYRISNLNICIKLKKGEPIETKQINELRSILIQYPQLKEETLLKIIGVSSIQRLIDITKQEIVDLTPDSKKRAIKLQIAADWKYFVQLEDEALKIKEEAVGAWEEVGHINSIQRAKKELEEMLKLCKGQKIDSLYIRKLTTIRKIVQILKECPDPPLNELLERRKIKKSIPIVLPYIIKNMELIQNEKKAENASITTSTLKKKGIVEERREIAKKFYEEVSKNNFYYANCVLDNRFSFEMMKKLSLMLGILDRIYKGRCRMVWEKFKNLPAQVFKNDPEEQ